MYGEENKRISGGAKFLLVSTAVLFDLLGFIPLLGPFINGAGTGFIYFWFITKRVKPIRNLSKRKVRLLINIFGETVVESMLGWPGTTLMTIQTIHEAEKEDKEATQKNTKNKSKKIAQSQQQKQQLVGMGITSNK